jgi:hypothetical protein
MRPGFVISVMSVMALTLSVVAAGAIRDVTWADLPVTVQQALTSRKIDAAGFAGWVKEIRAANDTRLRDGNYDHLIHYALQSTRVTSLPPIEPALSAKAFVESKKIPDDARARLIAFASVLSKAAAATAEKNGNTQHDARIAHFRGIAGDLRGAALETRLMREYERAMRFLYEKEFVAGRARAGDSAAAVAALYQTRGHSSDTEIEAGYAVYAALATLKQLAPSKPVTRVLVVGPGLDLAPRTALLEAADPQSYQPFAVLDALRALRMTGGGDRGGSVRLDAVDLNPHVASAIEHAVRAPALTLHVTSGIADTGRTRFTEDYRAYLASFGRAINAAHDQPPQAGGRGHVHKAIPIAKDVRDAIHATRLDIVTERGESGYDLVIVTNVFPYLSDAELIVATANIAAALAPGGALIHNEPRPLLQSTAASIGLPAVHARSVLIATVPGGNDLYDAIWVHQKR